MKRVVEFKDLIPEINYFCITQVAIGVALFIGPLWLENLEEVLSVKTQLLKVASRRIAGTCSQKRRLVFVYTPIFLRFTNRFSFA